MRNPFLVKSGAIFCIIFAFLRQVGRCETHFPKKGESRKKTLFSVFWRFLALKNAFSRAFSVSWRLIALKNAFPYPYLLPGPHALSEYLVGRLLLPIATVSGCLLLASRCWFFCCRFLLVVAACR